MKFIKLTESATAQGYNDISQLIDAKYLMKDQFNTEQLTNPHFDEDATIDIVDCEYEIPEEHIDLLEFIEMEQDVDYSGISTEMVNSIDESNDEFNLSDIYEKYEIEDENEREIIEKNYYLMASFLHGRYNDINDEMHEDLYEEELRCVEVILEEAIKEICDETIEVKCLKRWDGCRYYNSTRYWIKSKWCFLPKKNEEEYHKDSWIIESGEDYVKIDDSNLDDIKSGCLSSFSIASDLMIEMMDEYVIDGNFQITSKNAFMGIKKEYEKELLSDIAWVLPNGVRSEGDDLTISLNKYFQTPLRFK